MENQAQDPASTQARTAAAPCPHRQREYLGSDSGALFYRCLRCASVLVTQSGRTWALPPLRER